MKNRELKKLRKVELLQILIELTEQNERLSEQLELMTNQLKRREIMIDRAGSIAEASLLISGVFEQAEEAAKLYLENVTR